MALTAWQQAKYEQTLLNGGQGSVQEVLDVLGFEHNTDNYSMVKNILANAGINAPTTRAENQARLAEEGIAAGTGKPLTEWQQAEYQRALAAGESERDVASRFNLQHGIPVRETEVHSILKAAGLKLPERKPFGQGGTGPTQPALTPKAPEYAGGLPGRQDQGGMYGTSPDVPDGIVGTAVPRHPGLRAIFAQARRKNSPGYKGQTSTILTGARGATGEIRLARKMLMGS
jgi:hypothetical protein